MTLSEAEQIIVKCSSDIWINKISIPIIERARVDLTYAQVRDDFFLGENKRKYSYDDGSHAFSHRMALINMSRELAKAIRTICAKKYWTGELKRFNYVLKKQHIVLLEQVHKEYIWI